MRYLRTGLSGLAAVLVGVLGPMLLTAFRGINNSKATGLAAINGMLRESLLSPWCWILILCLFVLFYALSRLRSKRLRVFLFWTPVTAISTLGISILGLFTYVWIHFYS